MQELEVPEVVVRRLSLWDLVVRFRLAGMDDVWELDRILNEEHRDVLG